MKKAALIVAMGLMAASVFAAPWQPEIKLRDVKLDGLMLNNSGVSLTATFDVKREDLFDTLYIDFFLLLEPRDDEQPPLIFHIRNAHRFIEKESGYTSWASLDAAMVKCINPRKCKYAVVMTCRGNEVAVENSEEQRWWEDEALGKHIENVLYRGASLPMVHDWEVSN